jgi:hypothetical protein
MQLGRTLRRCCRCRPLLLLILLILLFAAVGADARVLLLVTREPLLTRCEFLIHHGVLLVTVSAQQRLVVLLGPAQQGSRAAAAWTQVAPACSCLRLCLLAG